MRAKTKELSLEQKAKLVVGGGKWQTRAIPEADIPSLWMCDGPNGVRKENPESEKSDQFNEFNSFPATCMPCGSALASSWDKTLCRAVGGELGVQARALGVNVLLGPGINHKRTPVGGRNFEYFSEDPFLTGRLAGAYIDGLQEQGVGCSLKHFYANNTEYHRLNVDVRMDERVRQEIYLAAYEYVVKYHRPATVMAAYNKVDGEFCTENARGLTRILREEWGFDGLVVSDWWATHDRVKSLNAGCNLEMPFVSDASAEAVVAAVKEGRIREEQLDEMADGLLNLIDRVGRPAAPARPLDPARGHRAAVLAAEKCIVLLKNERLLPLKGDFCFIGVQAKRPSYQGAGSSRVNTSMTTGCLFAAQSVLGREVPYADGYGYLSRNEDLLREACALAEKHETAVLFLGLDDDVECESEDRKDLFLPAWQNELVERVSAANPQTAVVISTGAPVVMPWCGRVRAIVQTGLAGEGVGEALANVLLGKTNPSGRLAETYPMALCDNPSYSSYAKHPDYLQYAEGLLTGYRYYATKNVAPLFAFGHGLSYTAFRYGNPVVERSGEEFRIMVEVSNCGAMDGEEVVQLYLSKPESRVFRVKRELKGFEKVFIKAGEHVYVTFGLDRRSFSYYDVGERAWTVESGVYLAEIAKDALTPVCSVEINRIEEAVA